MDKKREFLKAMAVGLCFPFIAGCSSVECNKKNEHAHLYKDSNSSLCRYIESEDEQINNYKKVNWVTLDITDENRFIIDNNLFIVDENNLNYLKSVCNKSSKYQVYKTVTVDGPYEGYGLIYNEVTKSYEYGYGIVNGLHPEDKWVDVDYIPNSDENYRVVGYKYRFYQYINGNLISYDFDSLSDAMNSNYKYFTLGDLWQLDIKYPEKNKQLTLEK